MAKTGNFNHPSTNTTTVTGVTSTFAVARVHKHTLLPTDPPSSAQFVNAINGIYVRVNTIGGGGTGAIADDPDPKLGVNLDLNSKDITGTGNITHTGNITTTGNSSVSGTLGVQGVTTFPDDDVIFT